MAPKRRFLKSFLQFSGNKHSKLCLKWPNQKFENKSLFFQTFMALHMKNFQIPKLWHLGPGAKKLVQGNLGLKPFAKDLLSHKMRTLGSVFKKRITFSQELQDTPSSIMKSQKIFWPWALGPKNYIWASWAQKTYPAKSPEPWLQFSQTRPHFLKNHEMNPIKLWNLKKFIDLEVWGLQNSPKP